jgi:hypothetical protein
MVAAEKKPSFAGLGWKRPVDKTLALFFFALLNPIFLLTRALIYRLGISGSILHKDPSHLWLDQPAAGGWQHYRRRCAARRRIMGLV